MVELDATSCHDRDALRRIFGSVPACSFSPSISLKHPPLTNTEHGAHEQQQQSKNNRDISQMLQKTTCYTQLHNSGVSGHPQSKDRRRRKESDIQGRKNFKASRPRRHARCRLPPRGPARNAPSSTEGSIRNWGTRLAERGAHLAVYSWQGGRYSGNCVWF